MLPSTTWTPPRELPDLSSAKIIAIDTENRDPKLTTRGPAWIHGDGHCAGFSVATDSGFRGYFPLAHGGGGNLDREIVISWLAEQCSVAGRDYVFAGAFYDIGWLQSLGVTVQGRIRDVQICDALIDEENPDGYSLEALGRRWLGSGKDESELKAAANAYGYRPKEDLWKLHAKFVGRYGEADADRTLRIFQKQLPVLRSEGLWEAFELESRLTPILYGMTRQGIRVDLPYAVQLSERWKKEEDECLRILGCGAEDIWSPDFVRRLCGRLGIPIPEKNEDDDESGRLDKNYLSGTGNKDVMPFLRARAINRSRKIYLEQNLIENSIKGRIHPQYIQMKSEQGGCRTPRLASKNPNAQQFPKRSKLFDSKALRKCLIAEDGCEWAKLDYWSQEPIIQTHYALARRLEGAERIKEQFAKGVKLATFIEQETKGRCNYDEAKEVALGRSYGMGKGKMSRRMGISINECGEILEAFDRVVPFIKELADDVSAAAQARGFILMPLGYRRRFNYWQPVRNWDGKFEKPWDDDRYYEPVSRAVAEAQWGAKNIQRAYTYKAFNALCQGTGAIQAKKALVAISEIVRPTLPVHDEINSANITSEAQAHTMKHAMETSLNLHLPARAELDLGLTWQ